MKKFSFIVPVYNTEQFLTNCINSLLTQDIPRHEYEIICVNDGSSDKSTQILDEYEAKQQIILINKTNEGVSVARNIAINKAQGEYIMCIDSDDMIAPNILSTLYSLLTNNNLDTLICSGFNIYNETEATTSTGKNHYFELFKPDMMFTFPSYPWQYIVKRSVLISNDITFDHTLFLGEDILWSRTVLSKSTSYMCINTPIYFYRQHENSASNSHGDDILKSQRILLCDKLWLLKHNIYAQCKPLDRLLIYNLNKTINAVFCDTYNHSSTMALSNFQGKFSRLLLWLWRFGKWNPSKALLQRLTYLTYQTKPYKSMFHHGIL